MEKILLKRIAPLVPLASVLLGKAVPYFEASEDMEFDAAVFTSKGKAKRRVGIAGWSRADAEEGVELYSDAHEALRAIKLPVPSSSSLSELRGKKEEALVLAALLLLRERPAVLKALSNPKAERRKLMRFAEGIMGIVKRGGLTEPFSARRLARVPDPVQAGLKAPPPELPDFQVLTKLATPLGSLIAVKVGTPKSTAPLLADKLHERYGIVVLAYDKWDDEGAVHKLAISTPWWEELPPIAEPVRELGREAGAKARGMHNVAIATAPKKEPLEEFVERAVSRLVHFLKK
jgi:hypothetical protein